MSSTYHRPCSVAQVRVEPWYISAAMMSPKIFANKSETTHATVPALIAHVATTKPYRYWSSPCVRPGFTHLHQRKAKTRPNIFPIAIAQIFVDQDLR